MGVKRELQERIESANTAADPSVRNENQDLAWAIRELKARRVNTVGFASYYSGTHRQMIRLERLRTIFGHLFQDFRVNLCPAVIDAVVDRLQVASFTDPNDLDAGPATDEPPSSVSEQSVAQDAAEIWSKNRMHRRAGGVHQEAVASGDAFLLVWPSAADDEPVLHPQSAHEVAVEYDLERPGRIVKAAKLWREKLPDLARPAGETGEKREAMRLNLYYPDRIEKYVAQVSKVSEWPKASEFKPYDPTGEGLHLVVNEWGVVPVFHFANNADIGEYGTSELTNAVPVQDMTNYSVFSLLVGVEFQSLPQRYAINVEDPRKNPDGTDLDRRSGDQPFESGGDRIWAFTGLPRQDGDTGEHPPQIGQLPGANLDSIAAVVNMAANLMSTVTGTPRHHFFLTTEGPSTPVSGESQKVADTKLNNKVRDRQIAFGDTWAEAMSLAVRMRRGIVGTPDGTPNDATITLTTNWTDTTPRSEAEMWAVARQKLKAGVPRKQVFVELGYDPKQVEAWEEEGAPAEPRTMNDVLDDLEVG